ncbi:hypothetical protein J3Q64DRAFT_1846458 [Phycomyces blakesleeanus]|uniref:PH domain-containing protein n=2 Tax=Phycomyces blakesleeanus TaxID=4837 RepID=A0A163BCG0_PHYB8|nr:hypothetical protein PHYBLDRAFT_76783 [Phycomyces blakesleeanus NRRL 1555(-)]OAD80611.1 hypothetical protein PHYBLDRAFT_76783 [Phycomyces blakesleeanus NRRL 1555(-)]|eukprot:XP_018298651.1 hypothetical protein PHYBLDRAFT_76783 [Phycomyces blakesleeanus NRRL 1555(-)]
MSSLSNSTYPIIFEGWLLKQRQNIRKAYIRRYFVLTDCELRYYKNETDTTPQNILSLFNYQVDNTYYSRQSPNTFRLISNDDTKNKFPDFNLQAETEQAMNAWIDALQRHSSGSNVLDKWLDLYDISTNTNTNTNTMDTSPSSCRLSHSGSITSTYSNQSNTHSTYSAASPVSIENPYPHSSRLGSEKPPRKLTSFFQFIWPRKSSKPRSTHESHMQSQFSSPTPQLSTSTQNTSPITVSLPFQQSIIHPSEYNREDDCFHPYALTS